MKPTYREKSLLDYLFGGFMSTLKVESKELELQLELPMQEIQILPRPQMQGSCLGRCNAASVLHSAAVGGSVVGDVGPL